MSPRLGQPPQPPSQAGTPSNTPMRRCPPDPLGAQQAQTSASAAKGRARLVGSDTPRKPGFVRTLARAARQRPNIGSRANRKAQARCSERLGVKSPPRDSPGPSWRDPEWRDSLPVSGAGKILKAVLREPFWKDVRVRVNRPMDDSRRKAGRVPDPCATLAHPPCRVSQATPSRLRRSDRPCRPAASGRHGRRRRG